MQSDKTQACRGRAFPSLALATSLFLAAAPGLPAADAAALPPPSELVDVNGYPSATPTVNDNPVFSNPQTPAGRQNFTAAPSPTPNYGPAPAYGYSPTPDYGRQPAASQGGVQGAVGPQPTPQPRPAPPPAPYGPAPRPQPDMVARRGEFNVSPPSRFMPDEYFLLPMIEDDIPGILMPELDEDFSEPGMATSRGRKRIAPRMSETQLEPFFDQAKGAEKAALEAQKFGDDYLYRKNLAKAIEGYMGIIAIADTGTGAREEAWYGVARCEYRRENWWPAFDAVERSFPEKFDRSEVAGRIRLEMFIGERLWRMGHNAVPGARKDGTTLTGYQAASRVYAAAIFNQPSSRDAPLALLRRGDVAAMDGEWEQAAKFYRTVIHYYPESESAMQARSSLAEAVIRHRQELPGGFPEEARDDLAQIMQPVENSERRLSPEAEERRRRVVPLAREEEAANKIRHAKDYLKNVRVKNSRDAAVFLLGDIVSHYPDTPQAREAVDILADMGIDPPMVLSDGDSFPFTPSRAGVELPAGRREPGAAVRLGDGRNAGDAPGRQTPAPYSPARYSERPPQGHPLDVHIPGIEPDM